MATRVLLVDDHAGLRAALRAVCEEHADLEVAGEAPDGASAVRLAGELSPDVVVIDVRLPDGSGFDVARQIKARAAAPAVVMLSAHADARTAADARDAGAAAFVPKDMAFEELPDAVRAAAAGRTYDSPSIARAGL